MEVKSITEWIKNNKLIIIGVGIGLIATISFLNFQPKQFRHSIHAKRIPGTDQIEITSPTGEPLPDYLKEGLKELSNVNIKE